MNLLLVCYSRRVIFREIAKKRLSIDIAFITVGCINRVFRGTMRKSSRQMQIQLVCLLAFDLLCRRKCCCGEGQGSELASTRRAAIRCHL